MAITHLNWLGAPDLLFPQDDEAQTRYSNYVVAVFSGVLAAARASKFIREYTNRDGTQGLPPAHIGATSPYIDNGMVYVFYHDNANVPFVLGQFADAPALAAAEVTRAAAVTANNTLLSGLLGSDSGWQAGSN